jgi:hypothetical protein
MPRIMFRVKNKEFKMNQILIQVDNKAKLKKLLNQKTYYTIESEINWIFRNCYYPITLANKNKGILNSDLIEQYSFKEADTKDRLEQAFEKINKTNKGV